MNGYDTIKWEQTYQSTMISPPLQTFKSLTQNNTRPLKFKVFWDMAPCAHIEVERYFRGAYCLHHHPDDGGSMHLWNVSQLKCDYMAVHPRRL
jgi:hypothetical protein